MCRCNSRYEGRTFQRLQDRIRQHVPKSIGNRTSQERKQPERPGKLANSIPHCDSAIGNHLLHNQKCASHYKAINFLFSLKHDPISIYQSWNQFSSLFENFSTKLA